MDEIEAWKHSRQTMDEEYLTYILEMADDWIEHGGPQSDLAEFAEDTEKLVALVRQLRAELAT